MIGIVYFSGTGNTEKCVKILAEQLASIGEEVEVIRIENGKELVDIDCEKLIIGYPIHGFNAPENIISCITNLSTSAKICYVIKTSGEPLALNDNSSKDLIKALQSKGIGVLGELHLVMPYNIIFRHSDDMATKMLEVAREKITDFAPVIHGGGIVNKEVQMSAKVASAVCGVEHFGMRFNGRLYRVVRDKCCGCMACVKRCPMGNIKYQGGKFTFGGNCIGCMRCSFHCPKDAIRIGILDFLRVNGAYDFNADASRAKVGNYCKKSYIKYFQGEKK